MGKRPRVSDVPSKKTLTDAQADFLTTRSPERVDTTGNAGSHTAVELTSVVNSPLADRMRPQCIDDVAGQNHLLGPDKPLRRALEKGFLHSFVLWGPPGTGKTTLARLLAKAQHARFATLSAVTSGIKDIRAAIQQADQARQCNQATILFVDEVHRFNKAQQDAFLPFIEDGTIGFVGATTENPSFELNNALLSRLRVYVLKSISDVELQHILERALSDDEILRQQATVVDDAALEFIAKAVDGDARRALNCLELAIDFVADDKGQTVNEAVIEQVLGARLSHYDKHGEAYFDQISALQKSIRGSNPDAALYWIARMLSGGCDPHYILRRLVRIASEDVGNADPRALSLSLAAWDAYDRLGIPEGELSIAHAAAYLACAPKSVAVYKAYNEARVDGERFNAANVPLHLRNAPTQLMKEMGYGAGYRYDPDEAQGYSAGQTYFPDEMGERIYYQPTQQGLEQRIAEKLHSWRQTRKR